MVLGVDWMRLYNHILFYFVGMSLSFKKDGQEVCLQGLLKGGELMMITAEKMGKMLY